MSVQEMVRLTPENTASLEQSLTLGEQGTEILTLNPELWEPKTFEAKIKEPFKEADQIKSEFEAISNALLNAVETARASYANPEDLNAALSTRLGQLHDSQETPEELRPFDRLPAAAETWRDNLERRKVLLQDVLLDGATGVNHEAGKALALMTEVQSGALVTAADRAFTSRQQTADKTVTDAAHTLLETLTTTNIKEINLNDINAKRREIQSRYQQLCDKLEIIVSQDQEAMLLTDRRVAITECEKLLALKHGSQLLINRVDGHIASLKQSNSTSSDSENFLAHEDEATETSQDNTYADYDLVDDIQTVDEAGQLKQKLAAELSEYDTQLAEHQETLRGIDQKLSYIRELAAEERRLYRLIVEDLAPTLIASVTPGVQKVIDTYRNKAALEKIDGVYRQYIEAELWLANEFEPLLTQQLSRPDSIPADQATVLTDALSAQQALEFLKRSGIIILNREKTMTTENIQSSQDHSMQVGSTTQETYLENRKAAIQQSVEVAAWGHAESVERANIGEKTDTIRLRAQEALRQLDEYIVALNAAMAGEKFALQTYDVSKTEASDLRSAIELTREKLSGAQKKTIGYRTSADEARAMVNEVADRQWLGIMKRAGLVDDDEGTRADIDEDAERRQELEAQINLSQYTQSAVRYAEKAHLLGNQLEIDIEKHSQQTEKMASLLHSWQTEARQAVVDVMEHGAHCGEEAIALIYALTEETIEEHGQLTVPIGLTKQEASRRILERNGQAPASMQELLNGSSEQSKLTFRRKVALALTAFKNTWHENN